MPKKLPFYWPDDPNCNKLRSRTLRVLRDRPNKLNSGTRPIQSLCDSYKNKHFKTEKSEKLRPIEDFHGFLSSEAILSRHSKNRARVRQLLQSNKQRSDILQNLNLNSTWKKKYSNAMAVDFDHMYIDCGDSKLSISRDIEFQHLKQMNLLHLDLIQQQTDQIIAKDKIIKALKEENKNLRARLERIDRRVSLSHQKKNALSPISVQTDFADDVSLPFCVNDDSSKVGHKSPSAKSPILRGVEKPSPLKSVKEENSQIKDPPSPSKRESLRSHSPKHTTSSSASSPTPHILRVSPRDKRGKQEPTSNATEFPLVNNTGIQISSTPINLLSCDTGNKKIRLPTSKRVMPDDPVLPNKKNKNLEPDVRERFSLSPVEDECVTVTDHSLRSRNKSHDETLPNQIPKPEVELHPPAKIVSGSIPKHEEKSSSVFSLNNLIAAEPEKLKPSFKASVETRKIRGEGVLTTSESYYLPPASDDFYETAVEGDQTQVEIPKWRIKVLTSLYVMEGTENLEDEIFNKRHSKPEHDERRRKRWDLQRMREQRQYEKLLERYEGRNNPNGPCGRNHSSLWPHPDSTQILQVDNYLPVCAFGQPLAQISESDFYVPWLTGKTPLQVSIATRRKKR